MTEQQIRITFQPSGRGVFVLSGTKIIEASSKKFVGYNWFGQWQRSNYYFNPNSLPMKT